jgi:ribonuclease BN (tRNA processing enzyme)
VELTTISTGSKGNCYILKSNSGHFCILDCGIKMKDITNHKKFDGFINLDFVFVSHEHKDHSLSLKEFERSGVDCISYENITTGKTLKIGEWTIYPFPVQHNALNYGAIIYNSHEQKKIVYATDFVKMPKITNVDYWLYEINYDEFTVDKLIETKDLEDLHVANNVKYHNSLESAVEYFSGLEKKPKLVVACHLSNIGGCDKNILRSMRPLCDKVEIATKNKTIKF